MEADINLRTVGCRLDRFVPDAQTVTDIQTIVRRVHEATIHATALLNLHVRRCIRDNVSLQQIFEGNWIIKAFQEVTFGNTSCTEDVELRKTRETLMPTIENIARTGVTQLMFCGVKTKIPHV